MGSLCRGRYGSFQRKFEPFAAADAAEVEHSNAIEPPDRRWTGELSRNPSSHFAFEFHTASLRPSL